MTAKRFFPAAVFLYAFLSLFAPQSPPAELVETSALLFARPWESLLSFLVESVSDGSPDSGQRTRGRFLPAAPGAENDLWWKKVFALPAGLDDRVVLGGRLRFPLKAGATRCVIDLGRAPPLLPGDPVVFGAVLLGFVGSVDDAGFVSVLFLNNRDARVVAAETAEGVAGESVFFVAGGNLSGGDRRNSGREGDILLQCPSSRFGLLEGCRVLTSLEYNRPDVPPGFLLGMVRAGSVAPGGGRAAPSIVPALDPRTLFRMAVLVPRDRPGAAGRASVPALRVDSIAVGTSLPPGFVSERTFLRVTAGIEAGVVAGCLIVAGGYCVGRVTDVGFFSSRADLLPLPGGEIRLVRLSAAGPELLRLEVVRRSGRVCVLKGGSVVRRLEAGCPLYLAGDPCSGSEFYPVCRVLDPGKGSLFTVRCGDAGGRSECLCPVVSS